MLFGNARRACRPGRPYGPGKTARTVKTARTGKTTRNVKTASFGGPLRPMEVVRRRR
jgi:hypothetical protein